ncbi:MAG: hypothetical protein LQ338_008215 [Usnochroma carphineum]|nr:MAG: hypothetical protein LQ338_008215 [Usnochroma carphineum]
MYLLDQGNGAWVVGHSGERVQARDAEMHGGYLVPNGPGYGDISHQARTAPGAIPGLNLIPGDRYMRQSYSDESKTSGAIIALSILRSFLFLNVVPSEKLIWGLGGKTVMYYAKEKEERTTLSLWRSASGDS